MLDRLYILKLFIYVFKITAGDNQLSSPSELDFTGRRQLNRTLSVFNTFLYTSL